MGFDPAVIAHDRRGITESLTGRMQRHGGQALIHSAPGEGTEIELRLPLDGRAESGETDPGDTAPDVEDER
ncbi:hypothetical protein BH23ACT9_BH23ACT9_07480 [soil metagenome]